MNPNSVPAAAGAGRVPVLVVGLGNPLMGDDGIGLAALGRLQDGWELDGVELLDGGTWGMSLLPRLEDADAVLLLDAIRTGVAPGTLHRIEREEIHCRFSHKLSPHQVDMAEVLALAELRDRLPPRLVALGVEPETIAFQQEMTAPAAAGIPPLVAASVTQLRAWGVRCTPREALVGA